MKKFIAPIAGALFLTQPLVGQTFTLDQDEPYGLNTYRSVMSYAVEGDSSTTPPTPAVTFNDALETSGGPTYGVNPIALNETILTMGDGSEVSVFDVCFEIFIGPTGSSTYTVTEGLGPNLDATRQAQVRALFSNALAGFVFSPTDYDNSAVHGAAIQMALWEIAQDTNPFLTLEPGTPDSGDLSVTSFGSVASGDAVDLAELWLGNIRSGTWTDQGGYIYYHADAVSEQDRLWVTPIPEPSTALLGGLGGLLLLRRRRA